MTNRYQKVLLAVDFHEDNVSVVKTAKELSELYSADLHVVHVREPLGLSCAVDGLSWVDEAYALEERVHKENKKKMTELGNELGLAEESCYMLEGRPASVILDLSAKGGFDLIVLGTHGQHGLQLLLGCTANSVMHGSGCDVLAVRIRD